MSNIIKRDSPASLGPHTGPHAGYFGSDPSEERLEARLFIHRLFRRKYQILAFILAALIPTAIFTFLATPLYRSYALIQINPDPVKVLPFTEIADLTNATPYYEVYMKTQEQVLRGQTLNARVRQRLKSEKDSDPIRSEIPYLYKRYGVRRIENSQLFEISYLSPVPEVAANVVNIYAEEYIKELFQSRQDTRQKARKLLEKELQGIESQVEASEKELVQYARKNKITGGEPGKPDLVEQKLAILATQLADIEAELAGAESRVESIKKASVDNFPDKFMTPGLSTLNGKILELEHDLTSLRTTYGENWPAVVQKRNEIDLVRRQFKREKSIVLAQALDQAQLDLRTVERRHQLISISMNEQQKLLDRYRNASIQYNILRREVETNQNLYEGLLERLRQTSVTAGLEFGNIHIVEPGNASKKPYSPKIIWNLGLGGLAGLALGICFALIMDFWDNSISTLEEVEQLAHLPALGAIPRIKTIKGKIAAGSESSKSSIPGTMLSIREQHKNKATLETYLSPEAAEGIRTVCASILLSKSDHPPRIIMVTSATPAEGKSTILNYLGRAFAENGSKTLFVESDMRKPALSETLGIGTEGGLSLYLSGHVNPLPKIHSTANPNLFAISAGPKPPNPVNLLNSEKLDALLNNMSYSYQFILLDAPPVLAVADARVLCSKVDGIILVVRAGRTPRNLIRRAWNLIEASGGNILGIVLNEATRTGSESSYYSYYYQ